MTALPAELEFGFVYFRTILAIADSNDVGREPDAQGASGTVTFTSKVPVVKTLLPEPVTIGKQVITCALDSEGYLIDPRNERGVWLVAGEYVVTYDIANIILPNHDISVESTHTEVNPLNLTTAIPPPGETLLLSQYTELNGRVLVLESYPKITASPAGSPPSDPEVNQIWVKY